jgi:hypothetical protein
MAMSLTQYSRRRGCSVSTVQDAIASGRITRNSDGLIDEKQADQDWQDHSNLAMVRPRQPYPRNPAVDGDRRRAMEAAIEPAAPEERDFSQVRLTYADARARKENFVAKLKHIELEQKLGNVLPRETVVVTIENLFRVHRDAVLNIPNRVAAQVFEQASVADVHALLESELRASLEELSTTLAQMANQKTSINPRPAGSSRATV